MAENFWAYNSNARRKDVPSRQRMHYFHRAPGGSNTQLVPVCRLARGPSFTWQKFTLGDGRLVQLTAQYAIFEDNVQRPLCTHCSQREYEYRKALEEDLLR